MVAHSTYFFKSTSYFLELKVIKRVSLDLISEQVFRFTHGTLWFYPKLRSD